MLAGTACGGLVCGRFRMGGWGVVAQAGGRTIRAFAQSAQIAEPTGNAAGGISGRPDNIKIIGGENIVVVDSADAAKVTAAGLRLLLQVTDAKVPGIIQRDFDNDGFDQNLSQYN